MNYKKILFAALAVFGLVFLLEFVIHTQLLVGLYEDTSDLWRDKEDYKMGYMLFSQFSFALFVAMLCTSLGAPNSKCKYINSSIFGLILASLQIATISYMPIPCALGFAWAGTAFLKGSLS